MCALWAVVGSVVTGSGDGRLTVAALTLHVDNTGSGPKSTNRCVCARTCVCVCLCFVSVHLCFCLCMFLALSISVSASASVHVRVSVFVCVRNMSRMVHLSITISHATAPTHRLVDQHGRTRLFHGTNTVQKLHPFVPQTDHFDATSSLSVEVNEAPRSDRRDDPTTIHLRYQHATCIDAGGASSVMSSDADGAARSEQIFRSPWALCTQMHPRAAQHRVQVVAA
jgi:hypothetical protein